MEPGDILYDSWVNPPMVPYLNFYVFSYDQPIVKGQRPKVVKRGPYAYK